MNSVKKIGSIVLSIFLWLIIAAAALFAFTALASKDTSNVSSLGGYTPMTVESDSMLPTFKAGDLIIIKACDTAALQTGDIICFHAIIENRYALNTHRIVEIQDNGGMRSYVTQGDNNIIADKHVVSDSDIVGKYVFKSAVLGWLMSFLKSAVGFILVIILPLLVFLIYQVYHLIMIAINLKKATILETRQAEEEAKKAGAQDKIDELNEQAKKAREEAAAALEEARRIKAEAEAQLAQARGEGKAE